MRTNLEQAQAAERSARQEAAVHQTTREGVMNALRAVIAAAPERERAVLAQTLEGYAKRYHRSYRDLRTGRNFTADMLEAIELAADCRIEWE